MNISQNNLSPNTEVNFQHDQNNVITGLSDALNIKPFISLTHIIGRDSIEAAHPLVTFASGTAIITYVISGEAAYSDSTGKQGILKKFDWSWIIAGAGIGYSITPQTPDYLGIQLCIALSPALENSPPQSAYLTPALMPQNDPIQVLIGWHSKNRGTFAVPALVNYFVVHLNAEQEWSFELPLNHQFAWAALIDGQVETTGGDTLSNRPMLFNRPTEKITFCAQTDSILVVGSSPEFGYDLIAQLNSVHTSPEALQLGLKGIAEAQKKLGLE